MMRLFNYGCGESEFRVLLTTQEGKCAICRLPETNTHKGRLRTLAVDHDHLTGRIRGLLCGACNSGLASFRHDLDTMNAAIAYLDNHAPGLRTV